jgi:phosphoglycerate dehydrogenase-like enzyme
MTGGGRPTFRVALTADFSRADGSPRYADCGLGVFTGHPHVEVSRFERHEPEIAAEQLRDVHGVIVMTPRVTRASLAASGSLLAVGRFGVGFDGVDVAACTAAGVLVMITAGAVNHSMAEATVAWMLALTHHVTAKDRLVRTGRWDDRPAFMGSELRDRTLGIVGFGGIGRTLVPMLAGFRMRQPIVFDPFVAPDVIAAGGGRAAGLHELLETADFVSINCPLTPETRGLIGPAEIALLRPTAYLLNLARGGIVDEAALLAALRERRIAGAALDCFAVEPAIDLDRFADLDNLLLAPHAIGWTNELFRDIGAAACRAMLDLSLGRQPSGVLNPELFGRREFLDKWAAVIGRDVPVA